MNTVIYPYQAALIKQWRSAVCFADSIKQSDTWIIENTADPKNKDAPFSFKDHEYQIDICRDTTPEQVVVKPSQVGASELAARRALCFSKLLQGSTCIYTMPTHNKGIDFCKQRFDTIIANSETLRRALNPDVDNTRIKQIGDSFLLISGTFGDVSAISVPARVLMKDEVNFSNQAVLGKFSSRLRHNLEGEAIDIEFSTPTLPGFGVSEKFERSDKKYYHVKHDACGKWVILNIEDNCIILPGFNDEETQRYLKLEVTRTILDLEEDDLDNPEIDPDKAWYQCPHCWKEVTPKNLMTPAKRKWIATQKSHISGWQIFPHDVPRYNPLHSTIRQITKYETKADWVNFCLGLPYSDSSTRFNTAMMKLDGAAIEASDGCATGTVWSLDVGKSSWYLVGKPEGKKLRVIYAEKIVNSEDGTYLRERVLMLNKWFGCLMGVADTAPDISTFRGIMAGSEEGQAYGCQYTKNMGKKTVSFEADEETQIVSAHRTGTLNASCTDFNSGNIIFQHLAEIATVKEHLDNITRITVYNDTGDQQHKWVSNRKPDHYAHSLNYLRIAWKMLDLGLTAGAIACLPMLCTANIKQDTSQKLRN